MSWTTPSGLTNAFGCVRGSFDDEASVALLAQTEDKQLDWDLSRALMNCPIRSTDKRQRMPLAIGWGFALENKRRTPMLLTEAQTPTGFSQSISPYTITQN
jgi:hypothetical protein